MKICQLPDFPGQRVRQPGCLTLPISGATGMASPIRLEGRVSLFPLFPPVDKFAEHNNPVDQKHL
jgi:hypothetical protein